jgi:ribosomal protein S8
MTNSLTNALISIKNQSLLHNETFSIKKTTLLARFIPFLYNAGLIQSFYIKKDTIVICLRNINGNNMFSNMKILSNNSKLKTLKFIELSKLNSKYKVVCVQTNRGFFEHTVCKKLGIGGKILFIC